MSPPRLHFQLLQQFRQWIQPKDKRHLEVFAEIIGAILLSQSARMSQWLPFLAHRECKGRSHLDRLSYFLHNRAITAEIFYVPILRFLLQAWSGEAMSLVLDTSMLWDQYCLIQVCLAWGGRSIPIAHTVLEHGSATVGFADYSPVLEAAKRVLPPGVKVLLLADRGFEHGELIRWLHRQVWDWAIRAKSDLKVTLAVGEAPMPVVELLPPRGIAHFHQNVTILGDVTCNLATADWPEAKEAWAVLTNLPLTIESVNEFYSVGIFKQYGARFGGIEPHFKDFKSGAFEIMKSRIRDPQALSCLVMMLAVAELFAIQLGFWVEFTKQRSKIDGHTTRGLSFLQLGLRQLQLLRHLSQPVPSFKSLPVCHPPPASASRKKQARESPKVLFSEVLEFSS